MRSVEDYLPLADRSHSGREEIQPTHCWPSTKGRSGDVWAGWLSRVAGKQSGDNLRAFWQCLWLRRRRALNINCRLILCSFGRVHEGERQMANGKWQIIFVGGKSGGR
ncbi:hypothetical protein TcWFU_001679 [Taenia crassiceps]|uniref:Uncharacterized protein n=1 Tax=Taenia crassiceps TaxID=6207 RepID=A0ABR4Q7Q4_9CEST